MTKNNDQAQGNRRGRQSKQEILQAAIRLMAEKGYAATSISTLSIKTKLPKSAIYHHFGSKLGLLESVMEYGAKHFYQNMRTAHAKAPEFASPTDAMHWYLQQTGAVFLQHSYFLRLHLILVLSAEAPATRELIKQVRYEGRIYMHNMIRLSFQVYGDELATKIADQLTYFAITGFDGAVIECQADESRKLANSLDLLAKSIALMGESIAADNKLQ